MREFGDGVTCDLVIGDPVVWIMPSNDAIAKQRTSEVARGQPAVLFEP